MALIRETEKRRRKKRRRRRKEVSSRPQRGAFEVGDKKLFVRDRE